MVHEYLHIPVFDQHQNTKIRVTATTKPLEISHNRISIGEQGKIVFHGRGHGSTDLSSWDSTHSCVFSLYWRNYIPIIGVTSHRHAFICTIPTSTPEQEQIFLCCENRVLETWKAGKWASKLLSLTTSTSILVQFDSNYILLSSKTLCGTEPNLLCVFSNKQRCKHLPLWFEPEESEWNRCLPNHLLQTCLHSPRYGWLRLGLVYPEKNLNRNPLILLSFREISLEPPPFVLCIEQENKKEKLNPGKEAKSKETDKTKHWYKTYANGYLVYFLHDHVRVPHLLALRICYEDTVETEILLNLANHGIYEKEIKIVEVIALPAKRELLLVANRNLTFDYRLITVSFPKPPVKKHEIHF
jgi:hypothetical protein